LLVLVPVLLLLLVGDCGLLLVGVDLDDGWFPILCTCPPAFCAA
jgi:hypothetical protein